LLPTLGGGGAQNAPPARDAGVDHASGARQDVGGPEDDKTNAPGDGSLQHESGANSGAPEASAPTKALDADTSLREIDRGAAALCDPATHVLISEIVTRPRGAEFIELFNPTSLVVDLSSYWLSDSHLYAEVISGGFSTASGSDFAARFPQDATIGPGEYRTVA